MTSTDSRKLPLSGTQWTEATLRTFLVDQLAQTMKVHKTKLDSTKNFDEYGLDSIDAVIATGSLADLLGIDLPPEFLFRYTSVDQVVRALLGSQFISEPPESRQEKEVPIFLFPGGGVRDHTSLIRFRAHSSPALIFDVVRIGDWRDWVQHDFDFDKLVRCACDHIEAFGVEGPLQLTGYSQGGMLAFATAKALTQAGRPVGFIGLIDSLAWDATPKVYRTGPIKLLKDVLHIVGPHVRAWIFGRKNAYPTGDARIRVINRLWDGCDGPTKRKKLLIFIARFGHGLFRGSGGVKLDLFIQMRLFWELSSAWLAQNDSKKALHVPAFLFRSEEPGNSDLGWENYLSDLTVVPVTGDHHTMFDSPHVEELVDQFIAAVRGAA